MVWDGDQLLYEVAAPGATTAAAAQMERDTGLITPFGVGEHFFQTGRVEYVHGHGIDAPLAFYREEYSDSIPGASFIPQANWRGVYDMGVRYGNCYFRYWTTQPATPPDERKIGGVDTTSNTGGTSGTETLCADVERPAQYTWAYHQYRSLMRFGSTKMASNPRTSTTMMRGTGPTSGSCSPERQNRSSRTAPLK